MHSPIKDLALSEFTDVAPLKRSGRPQASLLARLRARVAEWRQTLRARRDLASIDSRDWAVGDYGISQWQAQEILRRPLWGK